MLIAIDPTNDYFSQFEVMFEKLNKFISENRIKISRLLVVVGLAIIAWFLWRGYFYERFIAVDYAVSLDNSAKVGDFIGGVTGAIFTLVGIVLLYETLSLQRKELKESRAVFEKQQFENTFFSLLKLYNDIVQSLHFEDDFFGKSISGKDFFMEKKVGCYGEYSYTNSGMKNRKIAIDLYTNYYTENKEQVAHYYRTLYRVFKTIDESDFEFEEKMYYAKIVRAQLSESELFFINYNACTQAGENFRELIVRYNIVKHLPILERLEFKEWKEKLTFDKVNAMNQVFTEIVNYIRNSTNSKEFYKTYLKGKYAIRCKNLGTQIFLKIYINKSVVPSDYLQSGYGLDDFTEAELEKLLKLFFIEIFRNGNYEILKENEFLNINTDISDNGMNKKIVEVVAKNYKNQMIKLK